MHKHVDVFFHFLSSRSAAPGSSTATCWVRQSMELVNQSNDKSCYVAPGLAEWLFITTRARTESTLDQWIFLLFWILTSFRPGPFYGKWCHCHNRVSRGWDAGGATSTLLLADI